MLKVENKEDCATTEPITVIQYTGSTQIVH